MNAVQKAKITELLENFKSGKDRSLRWAGELGVMLDELYPNDEQVQDLVEALSAYNPGGGEYLYDENSILPLINWASDYFRISHK